jgi:hypothetical protein
MFDAVDPAANNPEDDLVPDLAPDRVVTKAGDLWKLGDHLLLCADALRRDSFAALMSGTTAQLAFVDPPFNVRIRGHVSGKGRVKHREFAQASGEKTSAQFAKFLEDSLGLLAEHSTDGAIHFVCSDWRHLDEMLTAGRRVYRELKNLAVWTKANGGMDSLYRSQHELIFIWKHGRGNRAAMAVVKMAMQMGFLEEADSSPAEAAELSAADEQILQELLSRRQGTKRR